MKKLLKISLVLLALALPLISGCSASKAGGEGGMSLMDRYKAGMPLIGEDGEELDSARAYVARGDEYKSRGRLELAFDQYSKAALLEPELTEARFKKGRILMSRGLDRQAMTEFSAAIEQEPKQALVLEAMGIICFRNGLYDEAEGNLANAVSLEPGLVRSHAHLGAIHNYRGDYGKAAASFKQAIAANPRDGSMYNNLGLALSKLDKGAEAVEAFRTALALGAPVDRTCNNLGLTLFRMGKVHEALEAFKCSGDEAAAYNNLGYAHFIAEEYHDAVACFERAIELRPSFYVRADENLKRARLALEFDKNSDPDSPAGKPEPVSTPERPVSGIEPMSATEAPSGSDSGVEIRPAMLVEEDIVESASSGFPSAPDARVRHAVASGRDRAEISRTMLKVSPGSFPRLSVKQPERPIFAVHLSSWRTLDKASEQVRLLGESGLKARVVEADLDDKGVWYRVVHGSYRGFDEALEAMEAVTAKTGRRELRVVKVRASAFGLKE